MGSENTENRRKKPQVRRERPTRRTFTIGEQLRAKLGDDAFTTLEGRMLLRTARPRSQRKRGGRGGK